MDKRGQLRISFGIIFSIFLIIIFIFFAFKAISSFMDLNECAEVGRFYTSFQNSVDSARESHATNQPFEIKLDSGIDKICFVDLNSSQRGPIALPDQWSMGDNFFLIFDGDSCGNMGNHQFKNLNITKITEILNPNCFENGQDITIKKVIGPRLVTVE
jgi:hypothetical protein